MMVRHDGMPIYTYFLPNEAFKKVFACNCDRLKKMSAKKSMAPDTNLLLKTKDLRNKLEISLRT